MTCGLPPAARPSPTSATAFERPKRLFFSPPTGRREWPCTREKKSRCQLTRSRPQGGNDPGARTHHVVSTSRKNQGYQTSEERVQLVREELFRTRKYTGARDRGVDLTKGRRDLRTTSKPAKQLRHTTVFFSLLVRCFLVANLPLWFLFLKSFTRDFIFRLTEISDTISGLLLVPSLWLVRVNK